MTDQLGKRARTIIDEAVGKAPNANQFIARSSAIGAVRYAVEQERERCAKIAEQYVNNSGLNGGPIPDIKKEIAAAIRAQQ